MIHFNAFDSISFSNYDFRKYFLNPKYGKNMSEQKTEK